MTDIAKWDRDVAGMFEEFETQVDNAHKELVTNVFTSIIELSPKFTGLYAANHEIHLGKQPYRVFPPEEDREVEGQFLGLINENKFEQLENINVKSLPAKVEIGNAVSYGDKLENPGSTSSGVPPVYLNSWNMGVMVFNSKQRRKKKST